LQQAARSDTIECGEGERRVEDELKRPERSAAAIMNRLRSQVAARLVRITQHAHQEMVEEGISLEDVFQALVTGRVLENYPEHRRGACCLAGGSTGLGRAIHVVCTTELPVTIVITVYEPKPPKWVTPTRRGK